MAGAAARFGRLCTMSAIEDALVGQGEAFYCRLLILDDHTLQAGGLPRDEVAAALKELQGS